MSMARYHTAASTREATGELDDMRIATVLFLLIAARPAMAQDQGLDPLLFAEDTAASADVQAQGVQLYRLPFGFHLRSLEKHPWGLRVTFPVSLSSMRIEGVSSIGDFVRKLRIAAIVPGLEMEIPVGSRLLVRPFAEVGIGRGSGDSSTEVMYGAGVRARSFHDLRDLHLTYGGAVTGRKTPALVDTYDEYAMFEAGVDAQVPLGFSVRSNLARGGVYVISRGFDGLELERDRLDPIAVRGQFEIGGSFSTVPDLRIWKIRLPWLAAGYQFGHTVSGVRIYATFPF
jgi:hypothetical protein